jgi:hypothetical protein
LLATYGMLVNLKLITNGNGKYDGRCPPGDSVGLRERSRAARIGIDGLDSRGSGQYICAGPHKKRD